MELTHISPILLLKLCEWNGFQCGLFERNEAHNLKRFYVIFQQFIQYYLYAIIVLGIVLFHKLTIYIRLNPRHDGITGKYFYI